ncbi:MULTISPECIES: hypothetical protein [Trichocoleus]|uniref:Uncharacterized protein n=1 Tax=Trichocoleus desertorum GB2-A4 TaxID=2933944 RepID=A0ABV0JBU2_9CYAN|nr:hypothetical protein [Trichocoleus sp. FACHB-262]MBD1860900.1 hypothetical protein [Trichocoleus sp. FACHB-46]MBD2122764.1 hypothetical protein [Trichocoleus sp. FACHB-262]
MTSSEDYKRQIMNDLAHGSTEQLDDNSSLENYQSFDDFAQRSSKDERRHLFGRSFHPEKIPSAQMEPELQKAIAQIKPNERDDVAREFFKHFKERGLSDRDLERQLSLSTHHPSRMNADDVTKLASFAYHNHPDLFRDVLAEQPGIVKFFSNPMVGAAFGLVAARWLSNRNK